MNARALSGRRGFLVHVATLSGGLVWVDASAAPRRAPKPEGTGPDGLTSAQLAKFLRHLQSAVKSGSAAQVVTLVSFPLRINVEGSPRRLIGSTLFVAEYPTLFTPAVQAALMKQKLKEIARDAKGAVMADGAVWVAGLCEDLECKTPTPKVVAIQLPKP